MRKWNGKKGRRTEKKGGKKEKKEEQRGMEESEEKCTKEGTLIKEKPVEECMGNERRKRVKDEGRMTMCHNIYISTMLR